MQHSEEIDKIIPALIKAQQETEKAEKKTPGVYKHYADYEDIVNVAKDPLNNNGIFFNHEQTEPIPISIDENHMDHGKLYYSTTTILWHESTQWLRTTTSVPLDMSKGNQSSDFEWAKNFTYIKRNQFAGILGLVTGEDDPEDKAQGKPDDKPTKKSRAKKPVKKEPKTKKEKDAVSYLESNSKNPDELNKAQEKLLIEAVDMEESAFINLWVKYFHEEIEKGLPR